MAATPSLSTATDSATAPANEDPAALQAEGEALLRAGRPGAAQRLFRRAAVLGHLPSLTSVGLCLAEGLGSARDDRQAVAWLEAAAAAGEVQALRTLGMFLAVGRGAKGEVKKNETRAVGYYKEAAQKGDPASMAAYGWHLAHGRGARASLKQAVGWYEKAAAKGHVEACFMLGTLLLEGASRGKEGVEGAEEEEEEGNDMVIEVSAENTARGIELLKKAAAAAGYYGADAGGGDAGAGGDAGGAGGANADTDTGGGGAGVGALNRLGLAYATGAKGLPTNQTAATRYYRLAAEAGNAKAQFVLGWRLATGKGVATQDREAAKHWYEKAAAQGHRAAEVGLEELRKGLNAGELVEKLAEAGGQEGGGGGGGGGDGGRAEATHDEL